jgi:hypothetical protein
MGCRGRTEMSLVSHRSTPLLYIHKKLRIALRHERFRNALNIRNPAPRQLFCPFAWLRWTVKQYIPHCLAPGKCLQMLMRAWHLQLLSSLLLTYSPRGCCTGHKRQCGSFLYLNVIGTVPVFQNINP